MSRTRDASGACVGVDVAVALGRRSSTELYSRPAVVVDSPSVASRRSRESSVRRADAPNRHAASVAISLASSDEAGLLNKLRIERTNENRCADVDET